MQIFLFRRNCVLTLACAALVLILSPASRAETSPACTLVDAIGNGITFTLPVAIATPPGERDRLFVVEKTGAIQVVVNYGKAPVKKTFLDMAALLKAKGSVTLAIQGEMGVLGLAFHPQYARNGYFFVAYNFSVKEGGKTLLFDRLSRFTVSKNDPNQVDPESELPLITQFDQASNHNGGDVHFGPDGLLYYSVGDEGAQEDHFDNARFIDRDFFAAILRLDVDQRPGSLPPNPHAQASTTFPSAVHPGAYKIPADNPFVHATAHNGRTLDPAKIRTEIWATGLRNPWRFSFDAVTNRWFVGDVGQNKWEEVDILTAGGNYGWSYMEGNHDGPRLGSKPADAKLIAPIYEYPRGEGDFTGFSVTGGVVSHSPNLPQLNGAYIFGDYGSRRIWALREKDGRWTPEFLTNSGLVTAFGTDPATGDVLVVEFDRGTIERLVPPRTSP